MRKSKQLEKGQKFGRLTVINLHHKKEYNREKSGKGIEYIEFYLCKCKCGNDVIVKKQSLISGHTTSCGCFFREQYLKANTKHNKSKNNLYDTWINIKQRCFNQKNPAYVHYGQRGISMCAEWKNDFIIFYNWAIENGYNKILTIDRIDNNGNYEPTNCRWVTQKEQTKNTRKNVLLTYKGITLCAIDWSRKTGIARNTLLYRIKKQWPIEKILTCKNIKKEKYMKINKASESKSRTKVWGCIYGQPGVGKTTLALSMPNPVLIDCERGIGRVNAALRKDYVELNSIDEFNLAELQDYDTIIFDTFGVLLDMFDEKIKKDNPKLVKSDGALSLQGFGARKILFKQFLADLRKSGKNVVFLAHVSEQKDGDITKYRPYATGSSINDLENDLDYMGFMEMRGQKRSISFTPGDQYVAKNSLNLPRYIEVPEVFADNHFMQELIVEGNKKRVAEEKANGEKYVAVITAASKIIADNKKDINEKTQEIMALEHIYDSKLRTWKALETLAAEFGLNWDKGAKLWK